MKFKSINIENKLFEKISAIRPEARGFLLIQLSNQKDALNSIARDDLKKIIQNCGKFKERKYKRRRAPKYGMRGFKAMPLDQVDRFFSCFRPEEHRFKVLFLIQAFLGLRIGEVVKINLKDIDFQNKQIAIHTEKKHYDAVDFLYIHEKLEPLLLDYIALYEKEIQEKENYLFFAETRKCKTPYVSSERANQIFRKACGRAGMNQTYGEREELSGLPFVKGKLYRWTPHSLRHSFGKFLAKRKIPIEIAQHLLRHTDIKNTLIYYVPDKEDIDIEMRKLFEMKTALPGGK